jgi:Ca2+/H+ antiporter
MIEYVETKGSVGNYQKAGSSAVAPADEEDSETAEGEDEEEIPEDLLGLSPEQQQVRIKYRSFRMMTVGTLIVLLFSDPMVDVLAEVGKRAGISPFYVSFVLAPLASNASELIAAYSYALKKTQKSVTISLTALEGAACMNNTLCLAIFMGLIYFRGLRWEFRFVPLNC